jgi:hypothetical protein
MKRASHASFFERFILAALASSAVLALAAIPACRTRNHNGTATTMNAVNAGARVDVLGDVAGTLRKLSDVEARALQFVSHGKIPTWEGLVAEVRAPNPQVHVIDTTRFDGHYGYTVNALGRGASYTENNFFSEVQYPANRRYMPFLAFDFRAKPIAHQGKTFNWVLQMRRYAFKDTDDEMVSLLNATKSIVGRTLFPGGGEPLILAYDNPLPTHRRPHVSNLGKIHAAGMTTMTENGMIAAAGASLVSVLNPGVGVGWLRLVKSGAPSERLTPRHVAIFEDTPERVPPVAGIVTLEPQTPLSHVNLLAKNRGTVNIATPNLGMIRGLDALVGKLVRLEAKSDGTIDAREVSQAEATAWWEARANVAVDITLPDPRIATAVEFASAPAADVELAVIGAKASNYAAIQKLLGGTLVKPGFAIGFGFYGKVADASGAQKLVDELLRDKGTLSPDDIDARLAAIREAITKKTPASATTEVVKSIRGVIAKMPGVARIRFRSSTNSEDLPQFNGAGLYESDGFNVADDDAKMVKKLLGVVSSLWLERAFWEREHFGIKHSQVAIAILINPAFKNEDSNGVVVARATKDGFSTWVNAQKGEASVTNPEDGQIPESFSFLEEKLDALVVNSRSNLGDVFLAPSASRADPATKDLVLELKRASQKLHGFMVDRQRAKGDVTPYGIDIEYKVMVDGAGKKALWIKQSRLLSLLGEVAAPAPSEPRQAVALDKVNVGGAHLRREPKQLKDLARAQWCLVPKDAIVSFDRLEDVGSGFVRLNVTTGHPSCKGFVGDLYLFKDHFRIEP